MNNKQELIFVYNADSSLFAQAGDYIHKLVSPKSYQCNLCQITYGSIGMKREWKTFIKSLPYKATFLHRDEMIERYPDLKNRKLPAIFEKQDGKISDFISAGEINQQKTIEDLKTLIQKKASI